MHKCCFISMVTRCKTIDKTVAPFTLFYCIHYQKTHRDTFCALSFLILVSPTPFTIFSLYSNSFPRHSNKVLVHSISSSSSWISRWLSCDISHDINRLIFYLTLCMERTYQMYIKFMHAWQGHTTYIYHLY